MDTLLNAHPIEIYQACNEVFNDQPWLAWEPETILLELKQEVSDQAVDKLLAVKAVAANADGAISQATAFEKTVNAFNNNICVMDVWQPPEVEETCYAVSQIIKIIKAVHGQDKPVNFQGEVPAYVAAVASLRGWTVLPRIIGFAQNSLDMLTGQSPGSRLRQEHENILQVVYALFHKLKRADARAILESPEIQELDKDDASSTFIKQLIGALLYDPTLLPTGDPNPPEHS